MDPRFAPSDSGFGMRAFLILVILFLGFLLFVNGSLGGVNLASNTPGTGQSSAQAAAPAQAPQVITIQENPSTVNSNKVSVPVTGGCTNPYTIQVGDTLSQVAVNCNTTFAAIRQANPQITDANLIYPGEQITIPGMATGQAAPSISQNSQSLTASPTPAATVPVPVTGGLPVIATGTSLQVKAIDYPANTSVTVAIGPQSIGYAPVVSGVTDSDGSLTTSITIPAASDSQTPWVVVVATNTNPPIQAMSRPFLVAPAGSVVP